jgi:hypothetical protein
MKEQKNEKADEMIESMKMPEIKCTPNPFRFVRCNILSTSSGCYDAVWEVFE